MSETQPSFPSPSFKEATRLWFKVGCLGFGGPAGQIALMHRLVVDEKKWVSDAQFLHALNFCMLLPGPEAQQLATYLGWLLHGLRGGLVAGILFVLPGLCVILALSAAYAAFGHLPWLTGIFFGLKCAVIALVAEALWRVAKRALKRRSDWVVAALAFLALYALHIPFPLVILAAAAFGFFAAWYKPPQRKSGDDTADRIITRQGSNPWATLLIGLGLWLGPIALCAWLLGGSHLFTQMGWFFAKMAVVTFGGAYAVLTYVSQQAVEHYAWLSAGNMIDGLALAETTPGPLILVLSFVGYYAAHEQPGVLPALLAGLVGSAFVTWVTFAPSFLWIFLGAPYIERLRQNRLLSAMLATVTAAVVGVIANLALWFALHVLFGRLASLSWHWIEILWPDWSSAHWAAVALSLAAGVALLRLRLGLIKVLLAAAALGCLAQVSGLV
jgi:chromate transporter